MFYLIIRVIMDWAKDSQRRKIPGLGSLTSKQMDNVMFEDLKIKLGYPYLYCHQGNCEHLMIFTDLRYLSLTSSLVVTFRAKDENSKPCAHAQCGKLVLDLVLDLILVFVLVLRSKGCYCLLDVKLAAMFLPLIKLIILELRFISCANGFLSGAKKGRV